MYIPGDWNAICDRCGAKFKASELKKTWEGLYVCDNDWEPRHSLDFLKAPHEKISIPWARPEAADVFVTVDYIAETVGRQDTTVPTGTFDGAL